MGQLHREPPSGMTFRLRHADHHTAGYVFTRDDREGHADPEESPQHWWCHDTREWMSWTDIKAWAAKGNLLWEPLFSPPGLPGCAPDGACGEGCPGPIAVSAFQQR